MRLATGSSEANDSLRALYDKYLEITGDTGTKIGNNKLYLKVKDEFGTAVRFRDSEGNEIIGTYSALWVIEPIYLIKPVLDDTVRLTYDGVEHSVYEALVGYDAENPSADLIWLMQNVRLAVEGSRSVGAGTFKAVFSLPNGNYAWKDANGNPIASAENVEIEWSIGKCVINLNDVEWGYDGDEANSYIDEDGVLCAVYTRVNGMAYDHKVVLLNLPDVLRDYVIYRTDGYGGCRKP